MTSPGIILVTKFVKPGNIVFGSYVDYIDRDEAVRNSNEKKYNAFEEYVGDYMDDHSKTFGLFTATKDNLSFEEKRSLKEVFKRSQEKGSLMWQTVISFDNDFLKKNGLFNELDEADESRLRDYTRKAMNKLLEKENLTDSIWSASVHKNTDNIHIHIAYVDPFPSWRPGEKRCRIDKFNRKYQRGKMFQKNLEAAKSVFANSIAKDLVNNKLINELKRERLINLSKTLDMRNDVKLSNDFRNLVNILPDDLRLLKYNNNAMNHYRDHIDALTDKVISCYCKTEYSQLQNLLAEADEIYNGIYGTSSRNFSETHINDLYSRMGNVILKEAINLKKINKDQFSQNQKKVHVTKKYAAQSTDALRNIEIACKKMLYADKNKMLNEIEYMQLSGFER